MRGCSVPRELTWCQEVSKTHPSASGVVRALVDVSLEVADRGVTLVMGRSGSGKSTLLRILAAIDRADSGQVQVAGTDLQDLHERGRRELRRASLGYVFSKPGDNLLPYLTAVEHVELAADLRSTVRPDARALLAGVGLDHRAQALPAQLSGGERQRLAFVSASVGNPALLIADEPTAELDSASVDGLLALVADLSDRGAVVIATHDTRLLPVATAVVRLEAGRVS
jgi:putative ABC transport system ATP-binding protein